MRRNLVWLAVFIPAAYFLLMFFAEGVPLLGRDGLNLEASEFYVSRGLVIVATFAIGLGVINLLGHHAANILRRRKDWNYSVLVFVSFFVVTVALLWQLRIDSQRQQLAAAAVDSAFMAHDRVAAAERLTDFEESYRFEPRPFFENYVRMPLEATVMSLLGFYITYAAYRAFRIRSWEATVMMLSAAVVIVGSDSFGGWLTGGRLTAWADFDNRILNSGMQRGLLLGIGVAIIAASLRMMLGLERGILGTEQGEQ